uniref:RRP15-like protein n=1 Tax=Trichuris muris TaxID=70415 RepID=A0A5S6QEE6_TRIMR
MDAEKRKRSAKGDPWEALAYVKPSIAVDKSKNVLLRRVATKGVVRLFNAVKDRQGALEKSLKKARTITQQDKAIRSANKGAFYSKLYSSEQSGNAGNVVKSEEDDLASKWEVLRDDFLISPKLNCIPDWDKNDVAQ